MRSLASWSRVWHAVLALVVLAALVAQVVLLLGGGQDANSGRATASTTTSLVRFVSYFTVQSNLLVLLAAVSLVLDPARDGRSWRVLRLTGLLGITVTGLVFGAVLAPFVHHTGIGWWINAGFHYVSPFMAFLGWAVFGPRPRVDGRTVAWAVVWPIAWVVYTLVRGAVVGWYPYPFLDVDDIGYLIALRNTGFVVVLALVLLAAFRWLDGRLSARGAEPLPR